MWIETTKKLFPADQVHVHVRALLCEAAPGLTDIVRALPQALFGTEAGYFWLPVAQALEWGLSVDLASRLVILDALGCIYFRLQDAVLDHGDVGLPPEMVALIAPTLLSEALALAGQLLADSSTTAFDLFRRHYQPYVRAIRTELNHRHEPAPYSESEVVELGSKAAPAIVAFDVAATLTGRQAGLFDDLNRDLCAALQIFDDLSDFEQDFALGNLTPPVSLTLVEFGPWRTRPTPAELRGAAIHGGVIDGMLGVAYKLLVAARQLGILAGAGATVELIDHWMQRALKS